MNNISLRPLTVDERQQFVLENQYAFKYGAMEEFGLRDDHFEGDDEIISRATIESAIDMGIAYRIMLDDKPVGGLVLKIDGAEGELVLLFTSPEVHSKGIGYRAWCLVEEMYPEVKVWETYTPHFETRNIHFYVNRCGFHIVEYFNKFHRDPENKMTCDEEDFDGMLRFRKVMR